MGEGWQNDLEDEKDDRDEMERILIFDVDAFITALLNASFHLSGGGMRVGRVLLARE